MFEKLKSCKKGATAIEYSLIAGLFSIICITAYTALSGEMSKTFGTISTKVGEAIK
jgi:Flp pilus assembly pilin Flp